MKNNKGLKILLIVVVVSALATAGYFFLTTKKAGEHFGMVPNGTQIVVAVDLGQLIDKADINTINELEAVKKFKDELLEENEPFTILLSQIIENPEKSGVDLSYKILAYHYIDSLVGYNVAIAKLKDLASFDKLAKSSISGGVVEQLGEFNIHKLTEIHALLWNESYAMLLSNCRNYQTNEIDFLAGLDKITKLEKTEKLIKTDKSFKSFSAESNDIAIWSKGDSKLLPEKFRPGFVFDKGDAENQAMIAKLNFEKGEINIVLEMLMDDDIQAKYEDITDHEINTDQFDFHSGDKLLATFAMALNSEKVLGVMNESEEFDAGEYEGEMLGMAGLTMEEFSKMFKGDLLFSVNAPEQKLSSLVKTLKDADLEDLFKLGKSGSMLPEFTMTFSVDDQLFDKMMANLEKNELVKKDIDTYSFGLEGVVVYFRRIGDVVVMMPSKDRLNDIIANGIEKSDRFDKSLRDQITDNNMTVHINIDKKELPQAWLVALENFNEEVESLREVLEISNGVDVISDDNKLEVKIKMVNERENSLKVLLQNFENLEF